MRDTEINEIQKGGRSNNKHTSSEEGVMTSEQKAVVNRIARIIGHTKAICSMVENGRDCSEVLIQLSAVKAALNNTGKVILKDYINESLREAVEKKDPEKIRELNRTIDMFMK